MSQESILYVFDRHLDDTRKWLNGAYRCTNCNGVFPSVWREDRKPTCPKCVITDRVTEVKT